MIQENHYNYFEDCSFPVLVAIIAHKNGRDLSFLNAIHERKNPFNRKEFLSMARSIIFEMYPGKKFKYTDILK
jgi:hypothetical protein